MQDKKCPTCDRIYSDDMNFCLDDGTSLNIIFSSSDVDETTWIRPRQHSVDSQLNVYVIGANEFSIRLNNAGGTEVIVTDVGLAENGTRIREKGSRSFQKERAVFNMLGSTMTLEIKYIRKSVELLVQLPQLGLKRLITLSK